MSREMRFCRLCGYRLGEGLAEYAETMRLPGNEPPTKTAEAQRQGWGTVPPVAPMAPLMTMNAQAPTLPPSMDYGQRRQKGGTHWIVWVILAIVLSSAAGGALRPLRNWRDSIRGAATESVTRAPTSVVGVRNLSDAEIGGALLDAVTPPGGPADLAGLIGGDVITLYDGKPITDADDLRELLSETPIGQSVEIAYVRDGETRRTVLTTISREEANRLERLFSDRPEGEGFLGITTGGLERVAAPGTNVYGVRLGSVQRNRPADMAGLRRGDIVIEFDGIPIRTVREFRTRIDRAVPRSTIVVVVIRDGQRLEIPVTMGRG